MHEFCEGHDEDFSIYLNMMRKFQFFFGLLNFPGPRELFLHLHLARYIDYNEYCNAKTVSTPNFSNDSNTFIHLIKMGPTQLKVFLIGKRPFLDPYHFFTEYWP